MGKRTLYGFCSVLLLLYTSLGNAQEYSTLSNDDRSALRLQSHVLVDLNTVSLSNLQFILRKKTPLAVNLSKNDQTNLYFADEYLKYNDQRLIVIADDDIGSLFTKKIKVVQIRSKDIETIRLSSFQIKDSVLIRFNGSEELGRIDYGGGEGVTDNLLFDIWKRSGKLPNFIRATGADLGEVQRFVANLNKEQKVFGVTRTEKGLLKDVGFKNLYYLQNKI